MIDELHPKNKIKNPTGHMSLCIPFQKYKICKRMEQKGCWSNPQKGKVQKIWDVTHWNTEDAKILRTI